MSAHQHCCSLARLLAADVAPSPATEQPISSSRSPAGRALGHTCLRWPGGGRDRACLGFAAGLGGLQMLPGWARHSGLALPLGGGAAGVQGSGGTPALSFPLSASRPLAQILPARPASLPLPTGATAKRGQLRGSVSRKACAALARRRGPSLAEPLLARRLPSSRLGVAGLLCRERRSLEEQEPKVTGSESPPHRRVACQCFPLPWERHLLLRQREAGIPPRARLATLPFFGGEVSKRTCAAFPGVSRTGRAESRSLARGFLVVLVCKWISRLHWPTVASSS